MHPMSQTPAAGQGFCVECGQPFAEFEMVTIGGAPVCAVCKPVYLQRLRESGRTAGQRRYAGFWIRFAARLIDGVILGIVTRIVDIPLMPMLGLNARGPGPFMVALMAPAGALILVNLAISLGYEVYFLTTWSATIGKRVLGLKVIRADGGPISPGLAAGRYLGQILSSITLAIGYIMAAFDEEKRALHDRICNTRVIHAK
jgi:uncharacterized RDD family membrane protein YckC